jgi:hypothetical protein
MPESSAALLGVGESVAQNSAKIAMGAKEREFQRDKVEQAL